MFYASAIQKQPSTSFHVFPEIVIDVCMSVQTHYFFVCGYLCSEWRTETFTEVCTWLEAAARDTFSLHGWQHSLRIEPPPTP
jgi:hypothetical protein